MLTSQSLPSIDWKPRKSSIRTVPVEIRTGHFSNTREVFPCEPICSLPNVRSSRHCGNSSEGMGQLTASLLWMNSYHPQVLIKVSRINGPRHWSLRPYQRRWRLLHESVITSALLHWNWNKLFCFRWEKVDLEIGRIRKRILTLAFAGIFALDVLRARLPIASSGIGSESEPSASPSSLLLNSSSSSEKSATRSANTQNGIRHSVIANGSIHFVGMKCAQGWNCCTSRNTRTQTRLIMVPNGLQPLHTSRGSKFWTNVAFEWLELFPIQEVLALNLHRKVAHINCGFCSFSRRLQANAWRERQRISNRFSHRFFPSNILPNSRIPSSKQTLAALFHSAWPLQQNDFYSSETRLSM